MAWSSSPTTVTLRWLAASSVDQLRLGPVGVLELVDQDVAEASGDGGPAAAESRTSRSARATWSPKSMQPFSASSSLVRRVGAGQLRLSPGGIGLLAAVVASPSPVASASGVGGRGDPFRVRDVRRPG